MADNAKNFSSVFYAVKIGLLFVGSVVGAGFASGREILTFFGGNIFTIAAAVIAASVFFYMSCKLFFNLGDRLQSDNLFAINKILLKKYSGIFNIFLAFCYIAMVAAMLAGIDALAAEAIGIGFLPVFSPFVLIAGLALTRKGITGLLKISAYLVPLIILFIFAVCGSWLSFSGVNAASAKGVTAFFDSLLHSVLYVGMNMLLTSALLIKSGSNIAPFQKKLAAGVGTGVVMTMLVLILATCLLNGHLTEGADMPMVALAVRISPFYAALTVLILSIAIFLTLVSGLYPLENYLGQYIKNPTALQILIGVAGFLLSRIGFTYIVTYIYPLQGLIGVAFIAFCAVYNAGYNRKLYKKPIRNGARV